MTGPEHYAEAERLMDLARNHESGSPESKYLRDMAAIHATLTIPAAILAHEVENRLIHHTWVEALS